MFSALSVQCFAVRIHFEFMITPEHRPSPPADGISKNKLHIVELQPFYTWVFAQEKKYYKNSKNAIAIVLKLTTF